MSIADLLCDGISNPMLGVLSCGLHTPLFLFRDKDKRTHLKASFQLQVSDSYYTILPCREYFKDNDCNKKKKKIKDIFSWESKEILLQKNNKDYERLKKFRISQEYPS